MRRLPYLPNLLSSLRIALAPAMLGAAYSNAKIGFAVLLAGVLLTDLFDGVLARRWRAESELGRRLDRWGDGLAMVMGATGVFFLWPEVAEREWRWMLLALAGYGLIGVQRALLPAEAKSRPSWIFKLLSLAVPVSLVPLILEASPWPFRVAAGLQAIAGIWKLSGRIGRQVETPGRAAAQP